MIIIGTLERDQNYSFDILFHTKINEIKNTEGRIQEPATIIFLEKGG